MRSVLFGLATALTISAAANAERFTNPQFGLSIEKPRDWCVLSDQAITRDHRTILATNPQLRVAMGDDSYRPLYAFTRYAGSHSALTTTVKVGVREAGRFADYSTPHMLEDTLHSIATLAADVKVVTAPEIVNLAGTHASHLAVSYTLKLNGGPLPIASEMWVIRRGSYFVIVGTTYPPNDGADRAATMRVVNSLRLTS